MATNLLRSDGKRPVTGDDISLAITATVPAGVTLVKALATFKSELGDADADAIAQVSTTSFSGTTTVTFTLVLSKIQTALFVADRTYVWDVQAKDSNGNIGTVIPDGEVIWQKGATDTTT